jgi:hypothetical protein
MAIKVPRNATNGVELAAGERLGLLLAVAPRGGPQRPEQTGMLTVFEPHRFVAVTLRE